MAKIIPGILTADENDYHDRLLKAERVCDLIQIDLIDGKFANNTTVDVRVIAKYPSSSNLEVQLMVVFPQNYIDELMFVEHVTRIIFPFEAESSVPDVIHHIRNHGKQVGISINPETPVGAVYHLMDDVDVLSIYAGHPGFSGQKLMPETYERVRQAKKYNSQLAVEVDIGVNQNTIPKLVECGADLLVAASALYAEDDFRAAYEKLASIAETHHN